ncbi:MAG: YbhB/YbcL family Raf kinase inhibitor-like protein [Myxococcaceae bacterium]|nr:YbhB/YbcL family Raf kinase inhibitor-like protein [Myxococcaceae bacterium]MCI0673041.1 YbhB/YbcL family Raf kinase inhibitor-like protein [Myxococcaceae bacterium]
MATLQLSSPAFSHQGAIPPLHTCEGKDVSPELRWSDLPAGTKSVALIVDDPDAPDPRAPQRTWVHWVLYNLPPSVDHLPQGVDRRQLPEGTQEGRNDWDKTGWGGPCPPIGRHRYFFKLYALDTVLPDLHHPRKQDLERAMASHVLVHTEMVGTYQKHQS